MAGRAGKLLKSSRKIGNIIGLDPTSIGFDLLKRENRLARTDADYVQVIHTDGSRFGIAYPIGHCKFLHFTIETLFSKKSKIRLKKIFTKLSLADFYPNGGKNQPGCSVGDKIVNKLFRLIGKYHIKVVTFF